MSTDLRADRNDQASENPTDDVPDYADEIAAFHRAFTGELKELVHGLPLRPGMRILDVGCGDGFYLGLLSEHPAQPAAVVGLDLNSEYLSIAHDTQATGASHATVEVLAGSIADLPLQSGTFDFAWCAQSLYSFPEPVEALRQISEAVAPGGLIGVLENDTLHQVFLPWPMHIEMALRAAELESLSEESSQPGKFYIGRCLPAVFAAAGLRPAGFQTQAIDRCAPLDADLRQFLQSYLEKLAQRVRGRLDKSLVREFERLIAPDCSDYLLAQPHFTMTWLNFLALGQRPADSESLA